MFVSKSVIALVPVAWLAVKPVTEPAGMQEAFQVKFPPATSVNKTVLSVVAEQMGEGCKFFKCGFGLTVTI